MAAERAEEPVRKKARRCTPLARVTAEDRAKQFKTELYADGGVLFCRFCDHSQYQHFFEMDFLIKTLLKRNQSICVTEYCVF